MMYLIGQLSLWLLLTMAFAALAGWAFAAQRAAPKQRALQRERENLLRDLAKLASGESAGASIEDEREADAARRLLEIRDGRIAELERIAEQARAKADDAAGEIAELQRRLAQAEAAQPQALAAPIMAEDALVEAAEEEAAPAIAEPDPSDAVLQEWRLRYFEQRVRYLETEARAVMKASEPDPSLEWRVRDAEARASHLENEVRRLSEPAPAVAPEPAEAFASDADVDVLLRWRLLYLEKRVAHLQGVAAALPAAEPAGESAPMAAESAPDPDRWKWRARYLEARVRHLEQRSVAAAPIVQAAAAPIPEVREASPLAQRRAKPPVLPAARNGAPDDFTLIEGVSLQQQSTLYSLGVFHFDQIAAWTPEHVAWVDNYLRLRGRIGDEEWIEQAAELASEGPAAARREHQDA